MRGILRSRAHRLLSARLIVVEYRGRTSGRTFAIPLRYAPLAGDRLVALAVEPARKLWWRSFAEPRDAVVLLRRVPVTVIGRLSQGALQEEARAAYAARYPRSVRLLGDAALVVFERAG